MKQASVFPVICFMLLAAACSGSSSDGSGPSTAASMGGEEDPGTAAPVIDFLNERGNDNCLMVSSSKKGIDILFSYKVSNGKSWEFLVDGKSVGLTGTVWEDVYEASENVPVPCDNRSEHEVTMKVTNDQGTTEKSVTVTTRPCQGDDC